MKPINIILQSLCLYQLVYFCLGANLGRRNRQLNESTNCGYRCLYSDECISKDKECDGTVNCSDGTDETSICKIYSCPHFAFRCNYGGCINADLVCDGKPDCVDKSDESAERCNNIIGKSCKKDQFQCTSGQCIQKHFKCDGLTQCNDKSDETLQTCSKLRCPRYSFRCNYGACVSGDAKCDGVKDCEDGSDEDPINCGFIVFPDRSPSLQQNTCILPDYPIGGTYIVENIRNIQPGDYVREGTQLSIKCNNNRTLIGDSNIVCQNGYWSSPIGYCEVTCLVPTYNANVELKCMKNNQEINCSQLVNNTIIHVNCGSTDNNITVPRICVNGKWDPPLPVCELPKINLVINFNIQQNINGRFIRSFKGNN